MAVTWTQYSESEAIDPKIISLSNKKHIFVDVISGITISFQTRYAQWIHWNLRSSEVGLLTISL